MYIFNLNQNYDRPIVDPIVAVINHLMGMGLKVAG